MAKLTQAQADALLGKLSTDDDFRKAFKKDPGAALKSLNLPPECVECVKKVKKLATKDKIAATRAEMAKHFMSTLDQAVHNLEAS